MTAFAVLVATMSVVALAMNLGLIVLNVWQVTVWRRIGTAQREILLASWEMRYWPHVLADMQKSGVEVTHSRRWE